MGLKNYSFSIIIPYYNIKIDQIKQCLESLICQDLNLLKEIIVVNDNSDEFYSKELSKLIDTLNLLTKQEKLIRLITHENNKGVTTARKNGYYFSSSEIILFVDPDDWIIDKNWVYKLNSYFVKYKSIDLINFRKLTFENNQLQQVKQKKIKEKILNINLDWFLYSENSINDTNVPVWKYAYKRECLNDENFWMQLFKLPYEDTIFNAYLLSKNFKGLIINEAFYVYRVNNKNSLTTNNLTKKEKLEILYKWFVTNPNFNINNSAIAKNYLLYIFILDSDIVSLGIRTTMNEFAKNSMLFFNLKDFQNFNKKYKWISILRRLWFHICIKSEKMDKFLSKVYRKLKK